MPKMLPYRHTPMHGLRYTVLVLSLLMLSGIYASPSSLNNGLVAYWAGDNATFTDDTLHGHDGTDITADHITTTCKLGSCWNFTGADEIRVYSLLPARFGVEATINCWGKRYKDPITDWQQTALWHLGDNGISGGHYPGGDAKYFLESFRNDRVETDMMLPKVNLLSWNMFTITQKAGATNYRFYMNASNVWNTTGETQVYIGTTARFGQGSPTYWLYGALDECGIWNRSLTQLEIDELFNTGIGITYPFPAAGGDSIPPVITLTGINATYNETYPHDVNFTISTDENATCFANTSVWLLNTTDTGQAWIFRETNLSTGLYRVNVTCNDTAGNIDSIARWFKKDKYSPVVTSSIPGNTSSYNTGSFNFNISCTDENDLWNLLVNVSIGTNRYFNLSVSPVNSSYHSRTITLNNLPNTTYQVDYLCCDTHTAQYFDRPGIALEKDGLTFQLRDAAVSVKDLTGEFKSAGSECFSDKCSFSFNYKSKPGLKRWLVASDKPITYLPKSRYPGHFIIGSYWLDFAPLSVSVTDNKDGTYEVSSWGDTGAGEDITLNSIGSLNCVRGTDYFTLLAIPPVKPIYTPDTLESTNWFNTQNMKLDTTPGVIILLFAFFMYFALLYMAYLSRIPAIQALPMVYGFFLGWLVAVTISVIGGVCFIILALVLGLSLIASMF